MARPVVVLVSGAPCSGKSLLAGRLAQRLGWPVIAKDEFKELLFDALGTGDADWSARLSRIAFDLQFAVALELVRAGSSLLLEGNFRADAHMPRVEQLAAAGARLVQVACHAQPGVLQERLARRASGRKRHPGHLDGEQATAVPGSGPYGPLPIEPTLAYDTTGDPQDLPDLAAWTTA